MAAGNTLLAALRRCTPAGAMPDLEPVQLAEGDVLALSGRPLTDVVFPAGGLISLMSTGERASVEVAMLGRTDLVGVSALLRGRAGVSAVVRVACEAHRLPAADLAKLFDDCPDARAVLLEYVQARTVAAHRMIARTCEQTTVQRLAHWLAEAGRCLEASTLPFTHVQISERLGVRRASVTVALHELEGEGLIRSTRGRVEVLDLARLQAASGELLPKKAA